MQFVPLDKVEAEKLKESLRRNTLEGTPIHMDALTTGWKIAEDEYSSEEALINAIQSVPCHY